MGFDVKNTTKYTILDWFCPHICRGCGRLGDVLCERCKNDMLGKCVNFCPICKQEVARIEENGFDVKCLNCEIALDGLFIGGERSGVLAKLVAEYKYQSVRAIRDILVDVLDDAIPVVDDKCEQKIVVVPLPTIGKHIRQRGLDHTYAVAKELAKRRGWGCEKILGRATDTVQVGMKADERERQAAKAYIAVKKVDAENIYVLVDDVWTTGASMLSAAEVMRKNRAQRVVGVVIEAGRKTESK